MAYLKYTKELLQEAVNSSICVADVCRYLGKFPGGSRWYHIKKKLADFGIDTSHFIGKAAHTGARHTGKAKKIHYTLILCKMPKIARQRSSLLRRALLESGRKHQCEGCGNDGKWLDSNLMLEIDHVDGDWSNCEKENLKFLCPNCHSIKTYPKFVL